MTLKKVLSTIVRIVFFIFFGLLVFVVTTLVLSSNNRVGSTFAEPHMVTEEDSCYMGYSNNLRGLLEGKGVFLYVETEPCAACSERAIMNVVYSLLDSCSVERPVMIYHPIEEIDLKMIDEYHKRFDRYLRVVVSREDSIMIKNSWIPKYLGFYGIVSDSLNRVLYAGSLFDNRFLECCYKEFGKR